jgi:hypothetical protein
MAMHRRSVMWLVVSPVAAGSACQAAAQGHDTLSVSMQIGGEAIGRIPGDQRAQATVTEDTSEAARSLIALAPPGRAVPAMWLVVGVLAIPVVWDAVHEMVRRREYGGVIIDSRQTPVVIRHDRTLPADLVLLIAADGRAQRIESRNFTEDMLRAIGAGR